MVSEHLSAAALVCSWISNVAEPTHSSCVKLVKLGLNCQSVQEFDTSIIVDGSRSPLDHFCVCGPPYSWLVDHLIIKQVVCHLASVSLDATEKNSSSSVLNSFQGNQEAFSGSILERGNVCVSKPKS